jgi:hypothetical protein
MTWGDQLYVTMIETAVLEILMILFMMIEFFTTRNIHQRGQYRKIDAENNKSIAEEGDGEEAEKKLRKDALKRLIEVMKRNKGMNGNLEELIDEDDQPRRRNSLPAKMNSR